jgi:mercuric ion transport protein
MADKTDNRLGLVATGSVIGAVAATSCCILPLVLVSLGAGGAWISNLTALAPYQPIFVITTLGLLAYGFWMVYRRPACAEGDNCARPVSERLVKAGLWAATICIAAALAFPFVAPALLGT